MQPSHSLALVDAINSLRLDLDSMIEPDLQADAYISSQLLPTHATLQSPPLLESTLRFAFQLKISRQSLYSSKESLAARVNRALFTGTLIPRVFAHISSNPNRFQQDFQQFFPPQLAARLRLINLRISMVNLTFAICWYSRTLFSPRKEQLISLAQKKLELCAQKCGELERQITSCQ